MLGVGAGAPAPPLVPVACAVACLPPLLFLRRRPCAVAAASSSSKRREQGRRRRRWWSDAEQEDEEEEEEEEGEEDFFTGSSSFGGELFDEPWFSKVFRTYGFLLPLMLASMLVATGPKAFLMAMAIPLAQSAVSFLLDAISRVGRRRRKRRPFQEDDEYYEEEYEEFSDRSKSYHQSWVSEEEDDSSAKKSSSSFGGWDELLEKNKFASKGEEATGTRTAYDGPAAQGLSRRRFRRMSSATNKYKQAPLLMRLIVALFPFLGSWFRLL